jgi:hypothetical protein
MSVGEINITLQPLTVQATASTRAYAAVPYLIGAARFSRLVGEIENANSTKEFGDFWEEMRDHATACVFFADAAIESYANELFADANKVFPSEFIAGLDLLWSELERKKSSLEKLDLALSLRDKPRLDQKTDILKAVKALGRLRNELTHFKPEWSHNNKKHKSISNELKSYFAASVWLKNEHLFPRAWVGHPATVWVVETAVAFLKEFERQADLTDRTNWQAFAGRLVA